MLKPWAATFFTQVMQLGVHCLLTLAQNEVMGFLFGPTSTELPTILMEVLKVLTLPKTTPIVAIIADASALSMGC